MFWWIVDRNDGSKYPYVIQAAETSVEAEFRVSHAMGQTRANCTAQRHAGPYYTKQEAQNAMPTDSDREVCAMDQ